MVVWSALASHTNSHVHLKSLTTAYCSQGLLVTPASSVPLILPPLISPVHTPSPCFSVLPTEHLSPLWLKKSEQTTDLPHSFVPAQGVSGTRNQTQPLSPTPFPAATHSTTPFSCQKLRVLFHCPTTPIFSLCHSPWFCCLKHTQGLHS